MNSRPTNGRDDRPVRIYFCSDIHASRKCWKKFLAAAKFYQADTIIVGGDITGKFIVPIVRQPRGP
jgi:Icc-related predicted phosphoesterase